MEFKRKSYIERLEGKRHNGMIKIITGLRRSGKSYLLFNLFYTHLISKGIKDDHIIRIALDDLETITLREKIALYSFIKSKITDSQMYYCLIDEIQLANGFEEVLNSLLHIKNIDIFVTGSNSRFLVKDVITEFRGRGDEIRLLPLSVGEICEETDSNFEKVWAEYCMYGGLPLVQSMKDHREKSEYLKSLFSKVYLTDVIDRYKIRNKNEFEQLLDVIASSVGSLTNPFKIENTFKSKEKSSITNKTITTYLEYLDDAFLIQTSQRFDIKGRKYIGANKKYFFTDIGLRNARLNFRQIEESHIMENILFNELKYKGFDVDVGVIESNVNENGVNKKIQYECDFVANKGSERIYVQSMLQADSEEKMRQEQKSLLKIPDSFKKIIVQKSEVVPHYNENGIYIISLKDFICES